MEKDKLYLIMDFEEDIGKGMPVSYIYREMHNCVQRKIDSSEIAANKRAKGGGMVKESEREAGEEEATQENTEKRLSESKNGSEVEEAAYITVIINSVEKAIRINNNIFEDVIEFILKLNKFLEELIGLSDKLKVEFDDVNKKFFFDFIFDNFNLFGDVGTLMSSFKPAKSSTIQRSGLTSEGIFKTVFLLQNLNNSMKLFLAFNVFAISIYYDNRYIEELLSYLYWKTVSRILTDNNEDAYLGTSEMSGSISNGICTPDKERAKTVSLLNGLYLLFDIFNFDELTLRNILRIVLIFLGKKRNTKLVGLLGLNDIFICTVRFVCEDCIPSHVLMMACRDKLNMKYKADSLSISMDYIYNWLFRPHLAISIPRYFIRSRTPRRGILAFGKPIEMAPNKVTVELTNEEDKKPGSAKGPAYSPLSRRLSGGLRGKNGSGFKSKQKLTFDD